MGRTKKDKHHQSIMDTIGVGRSRTRPRSTVFEDEIGKQNRRSTKRVNERKEIDEILDEETEMLNNLYEEEWDDV